MAELIASRIAPALLAAVVVVSCCSAVVAQENGDENGGPLIDDSGVGYIDPAMPADLLRFRTDAAFGLTRPNRAELFWPVGAPLGPGPGAETNVDYQEFSLYAERRVDPHVSLFGEIPFRLLNPERNPNTGGMSDASLGFKWQLAGSSQPDSAVTFQFRTTIPSGDASRGLGNRHASIEPGLLFYQKVAPRLALEGELRDWIAIGGTDAIAGNILRYGLGATCDFVGRRSNRRLAAVMEVVGWTVLDGSTVLSTGAPGSVVVIDAIGDTIVDVKSGLRFRWSGGVSLYAGYGRVVTGQSWQDDVVRVEFRHGF